MNIIKACNTAVLVLHTVSLRVMFGKSAIVNSSDSSQDPRWLNKHSLNRFSEDGVKLWKATRMHSAYI